MIAFITDGPTVRDILVQLGEPTAPPMIALARGPPLWAAAARLPAPSYPGVRARPKVPQEACGAARCHRQSTRDPPYRLLHTLARVIEMAIRYP